MRGNVFTGRLAGWIGLQALSSVLRNAGIKFEPGIKLESVVMAPEGVSTYPVSENIVITVVGDSDAGYLFTIVTSTDVDTADKVVGCLTALGAWVNIEDVRRTEIVYQTNSAVTTRM